MYYVDHSRPPWIEIALPPAIVLSAPTLITLYVMVLGLDFSLLIHERHLEKLVSATQLRMGMVIVHVLLPMIFISNNPPCNILFAAGPWFIASYAAHMPTNTLTFRKCVNDLFKVTIQEDQNTDKTKIRCKGVTKISLGVLKLVFMELMINPLIPLHPMYVLNYAWFHPMSLIYTVLFGIKAYCLLGAVDIFMGLEQFLFAWNMIDLFDSPILSTSPRDFWSKRWNKVVRNLLHAQVFTSNAKTKKKRSGWWSNQAVRGLLSFMVSGLFHELIIMSACRRITLENFAFFTLQGIAVMLEVILRQGAYKAEPQGKTRYKWMACQLLFMASTGRFFTAPFLRYNFFEKQ